MSIGATDERIEGHERWACLLGHPVAHSLSPAMHNAAFKAVHLDGLYVGLDVPPDDLPEAVARLRGPACLGGNVTAPHKLAVIPLLDELAVEARLLGAVNTIVNRRGRLVGDNTDARGLQAWLADTGVPVAGADTLVLGAGGAARATLVALARLGARRVVVANRTPAKAEALVAELTRLAGPTVLEALPLEAVAHAAPAPARVVVNATSLGHLGLAPAVHDTWYPVAAEPWAIDLAYNPPVTAFMRQARAGGARTENGLGMLVGQAALSFELWTGLRPPRQVFERAALDRLSQVRENQIVAEEALAR